MRYLLLPGAGIRYDVRNMAAVGSGGIGVSRGAEINAVRAAFRVVGLQYRLQNLAAGIGVVAIDNGLIDAVGRVVRQFDQEQQLLKGVVFTLHAIGQPLASNL